MAVSERALWVDVGGADGPDWVYVIVRFVDGKPDFIVPPRWATEEDVRARRERKSSTPAPEP